MPGAIRIDPTQIQMTISSAPFRAGRVYCNATQAKAWANFPRPFGPKRLQNPTEARAVRSKETSPYRSCAEVAVDFENRPSPRDSVRDGSGLGRFAGFRQASTLGVRRI